MAANLPSWFTIPDRTKFPYLGYNYDHKDTEVGSGFNCPDNDGLNVAQFVNRMISLENMNELGGFNSPNIIHSSINLFNRGNTSFPNELNILIINYVIDCPITEFINACVDNNIEIAEWLQKIFRFHKQLTKKEIQRYFEQCVCLANHEMKQFYANTFYCKFDEKGIPYEPIRCFITTARNNNENYKEFADHLNKICDDDKKKSLIILMIDYGCVDALKYIIDELKWNFEDEYFDDCILNHENVMIYLHTIVKSSSGKETVGFNFLFQLKRYIFENNDIKKITGYCESHIDIIRDGMKVINNNPSMHPAVDLMFKSYLSTKPDGFSQLYNPYLHKWIDAEIILYLIETFPLTSERILEIKDDFVDDYLKIAKNVELQNHIEKIISRG